MVTPQEEHTWNLRATIEEALQDAEGDRGSIAARIIAERLSADGFLVAHKYRVRRVDLRSMILGQLRDLKDGDGTIENTLNDIMLLVSRRDEHDRLCVAAIECASLWIEWASGGSKEGTELATRVRVAQEKLGGAAVDLIWAEDPDKARTALKAARGER